MKQLKTFDVLFFILATALVCVGCSAGNAPLLPTATATRPLSTPQPTVPLPDVIKPTVQPPDVTEPTAQPPDVTEPPIAAPPAEPIEGQHSDQPQTPITTKLLLSHVPLLKETAELTFTITTINDTADITAVINLPAGAALLSGETTWQGQLKAGQSQTLHAVIEFHSEGDWILEAKALSPQSNGDVWGDANYIYLHVAQDGSHLGFEPNSNPIESGTQDTSPPAVDAAPSS